MGAPCAAPTATIRGDSSAREGDVRTNNVGLFAQDTWTPTDRPAINAGLRVEKEEVPSAVEGLSGIKFAFGDKIAPALAPPTT